LKRQLQELQQEPLQQQTISSGDHLHHTKNKLKNRKKCRIKHKKWKIQNYIWGDDRGAVVDNNDFSIILLLYEPN